MVEFDKNLIIAWNGLSAYAANLIREGQLLFGVDFPVLATRPDVPIQGMESILGNSLVWIEPGVVHTWSELGVGVPDVFIHSGWDYPHFISLADEVRAKRGKVIGMFDNCWKLNLRQLLGGIYFRFFMRRKYTAVWVPGRSASKLARYIGFKEDHIYQGVYGSDQRIFKCSTPMNQRPKRIVFVGRLNHRKGVLELVEAFSRCCDLYPDWELCIIGNGELIEQIETNDKVKCLPFMQPEQVAELMNESRVFALASREEHWGLVVHEAALCGCALLLQSRIGSVEDLANEQNAELFEQTSPGAIEAAMQRIMEWDEEAYRSASISSLEVSKFFGPTVWANQLEKILRDI